MPRPSSGGPDPGRILLARGTQLNSIRRFSDAMPLLTQAIAADPSAVEPHCELAYSLLHVGATKNALQQADAALALNPEYERGYRLRSIILSRMGQPKEALAAAETAARLAPFLPEALYTLGSAQLGRKRLKEAEQTAANLVRIAPERSISHLLVGQVAIRRKQWKSGEAANRRVLEIDPLDQVAVNNLACALQGQGRAREALDLFQQAAQLRPDDPLAKSNIVGMVRPVSGKSLLIDLVRMIVIPWSIPFVLIRLIVQSIRSARRRAELRPGARMYYDREFGNLERVVRRVLLAILVLILGSVAIVYARALGWTFTDTDIPGAALLLVCALIVAYPVLKTRLGGRRQL